MKDTNLRLIFQILAALQEGEKPVRKVARGHTAGVYRYLKKLEAGGFVQCRKVEGDNGQMVQSYKLTEKGWTLATLGRRVLEFGL